MIIWIAVIAILIALIYFLTQRRHHDEVWRRFRQHCQERLAHPPSEQLIDPTFQFDRPPADAEKDKR